MGARAFLRGDRPLTPPQADQPEEPQQPGETAATTTFTAPGTSRLVPSATLVRTIAVLVDTVSSYLCGARVDGGVVVVAVAVGVPEAGDGIAEPVAGRPVRGRQLVLCEDTGREELQDQLAHGSQDSREAANVRREVTPTGFEPVLPG